MSQMTAHEARNLERVIKRLKALRDKVDNRYDKAALVVAIEHVESRLLDLRAQ